MKVIEERQKHEFDKLKEKSLEKSRSKKSITVFENSRGERSVVKPKVSREERKKKGD